jgi:hypothetical protein
MDDTYINICNIPNGDEMIDSKEIQNEIGFPIDWTTLDDKKRDKALVSICVALSESLSNVIKKNTRGITETENDNKIKAYLMIKLLKILDDETDEFLLKLIYEYIKERE